LAAASTISAQPGIGQNGVVNAASQIAPTLAGGAIARGALFNIYGVLFGTPDNTTVTISTGGATVPVKILSIRPSKIDAFMPASAPLGHSSLIVTVNGKAGKPFPIEVAAFN